MSHSYQGSEYGEIPPSHYPSNHQPVSMSGYARSFGVTMGGFGYRTPYSHVPSIHHVIPPSTITRSSDILYSLSNVSYTESNVGGNVFDSNSYAPSEASGYQTTISEWPNGDPNQYVSLPCDFYGWATCDVRFPPHRLNAWLDHVEEAHLGGSENIPREVLCWYCPQKFDAHSPKVERRRANFHRRIKHIRDHIVNENKTADEILPDWQYAEHLHNRGLSLPKCLPQQESGVTSYGTLMDK